MSARTSTRIKAKRGPLADISNQRDEVPCENGEGKVITTKRARKSIGVNSEGDSNENVSKSARISSDTSRLPTSANSVVEAQVVSKPPYRVLKRTRPLPWKCQDPLQCYDILDEMYSIFYDQEERYAAKPYMSAQPDITPKMRSILVDWLIEVHYKFRLQPLTLWLTINILDRYLMNNHIMRAKLQLVGVTALFIACKYEEVYPPEVTDCVYITDNAYDKKEVLTMESTILKQLDYQICIPTGYHFLNRYLNCVQASERTRSLASYYAERNLQEVDSLNAPPHQFAAAALYAALRQETHEFGNALSKASHWCLTLQEESGLKEQDIINLARTIVKHVGEDVETASRRRLVAAKKKYGTEKSLQISSLPLPIF